MKLDRRGFMVGLGAVAASAAVPAKMVQAWAHCEVALGYSVDGVALRSAAHPCFAAGLAKTKEAIEANIMNGFAADLRPDDDDNLAACFGDPGLNESSLVASELDTDTVNKNGLRLSRCL